MTRVDRWPSTLLLRPPLVADCALFGDLPARVTATLTGAEAIAGGGT